MNQKPSAPDVSGMFARLAGKPGFENTLRKLVEYAPIGILLVNSEHQVGFANPSACRILGMETRELSGQQLHDLFGDDYLRMLSKHPSGLNFAM